MFHYKQVYPIYITFKIYVCSHQMSIQLHAPILFGNHTDIPNLLKRRQIIFLLPKIHSHEKMSRHAITALYY